MIYTMIYTEEENRRYRIMLTAKIFENGRSQAVRLPKEYRFDSDEVLINKVGDVVMLMPSDSRWSGLISSLSLFSDDFMSEGREEGSQEREKL